MQLSNKIGAKIRIMVRLTVHLGFITDKWMDRLSVAIIKEQYEESYIIEAEAFGEGINMWLEVGGILLVL